MTFEQNSKEVPGQTKGLSGGKVFQAERAASAKTLKWGYTSCVGETAGRPDIKGLSSKTSNFGRMKV